MGLPEVNRARIEKLNASVDELRYDVDVLRGDIESIDPIISDESFPNIIPNAPSGVTANALFRSIQVMWNYEGFSYIKEYEVFASQEKNFHPTQNHIVWRGKSGGYNHPASTGETWYFKVRARNYHDEVSEFSDEVSASTVNISEYEIDEQYKINLIEYTNQYTDDAKYEIMGIVANKLDAQVYHDNIVLKADAQTVQDQYDALSSSLAKKLELEDLSEIEGRVSHTESEIARMDGEISLRVTTDSFNALDGRVSSVEGNILVLSDAIEQRVTKTTYDNDINDGEHGLFARMDSAEGSITALAGEIELRATEESVTTRIGDVVHELESHDARINANANAITQRVTTATYNALEGRVSTAEGEINTLAGEVALKASQADLDAKEQRLSTAEATLSILPGQIESKVEKDGVISAIRQSPESLKIQVAQVEIDGDVRVENGLVRLKELIVDSTHIKDRAIVGRLLADEVITDRMIAGNANIDFAKIGNVEITNAMIKELHAEKINAGVLDIERIPHLTADKVTIGAGTTFASGYDPTKIEIGGRNYITHNPDKWEIYLDAFNYIEVEVEPNTTYTLTDYSTVAVEGLYVDNVRVERGEPYTFESDSSGAIMIVAVETDFKERLGTIFRFKLEKGNKATDWSPAPEDVDDKIYNLEIGGRNLITLSSVTMSGAIVDGYLYRLVKVGSGNPYVRIPHTLFENDTEYVITFKARRASGNIYRLAGHSTLARHETVRLFIDGIEQTHKLNTGWSNVGTADFPNDHKVHQYEIRFKTVSDVASVDTPYWYIQPNRPQYDSNNFTLEIWDWQLEKGNKATDWSPAPEDVSASVSLTDAWRYQDTTEIDGGSIRTNTITANHIKSLVGLNVNDQFIVDSNGNVKFAGQLNGATGTFSGEVRAANLLIDNPNIVTQGKVGLKLQVAQWQESTTNPYRPTGHAVFNTLNNGLEIYKETTTGALDRLDYTHFDSKITSLDGKLVILRGGATAGGLVLHNDTGGGGHIISTASSNGHLYVYGNRADNQHPFVVRSHEYNSSYRNDFEVRNTGIVWMPTTADNTSTSSANMRMGSTGQILRVTSTRRNKLVIEPIKADPYKILEIEPKDWYDKRDTELYADLLHKQEKGEQVDFEEVEHLRRVAGLIAEEVEDVGLGQFAEYDENGEVIGIQYDRLWILLIPIVRDLKNEVELLKKQLYEEGE